MRSYLLRFLHPCLMWRSDPSEFAVEVAVADAFRNGAHPEELRSFEALGRHRTARERGMEFFDSTPQGPFGAVPGQLTFDLREVDSVVANVGGSPTVCVTKEFGTTSATAVAMSSTR